MRGIGTHPRRQWPLCARSRIRRVHQSRRTIFTTVASSLLRWTQRSESERRSELFRWTDESGGPAPSRPIGDVAAARVARPRAGRPLRERLLPRIVAADPRSRAVAVFIYVRHCDVGPIDLRRSARDRVSRNPIPGFLTAAAVRALQTEWDEGGRGRGGGGIARRPPSDLSPT